MIRVAPVVWLTFWYSAQDFATTRVYAAGEQIFMCVCIISTPALVLSSQCQTDLTGGSLGTPKLKSPLWLWLIVIIYRSQQKYWWQNEIKQLTLWRVLKLTDFTIHTYYTYCIYLLDRVVCFWTSLRFAFEFLY